MIIYFIVIILNLSFSLIFLYINILYFIFICSSFYHLQMIEYEKFMLYYLYTSIITLLWQQLKTHPMRGCRTAYHIEREIHYV